MSPHVTQTYRVARIVILVWMALFGAAVVVAGIVRAATPFFSDLLFEVAFAIVGFFFLVWAIRGIRNTPKKPAERVMHLTLISLGITLLLFLLDLISGLRVFPSIVQFILLAGFQLGDFLTGTVSVVWRGKFGVGIVDPLFAPMAWVIQFGFVHAIVTKIGEKRGRVDQKRRRK